MSTLKELTSLLSDKEKREFVQFLNGRNKRKDVKNIELFKSILDKNPDRLKREIGANAFNVLNKRLKDALIDFIAGKSIYQDDTKEVLILRYHLVAKRLFINGNYKLGFNMLSKAESMAIQQANLSQLNEIYHTTISYSYHKLAPDIEETNQKFRENNKKFEAREKLNLLYVTIKKAYLDAQFQGNDINLDDLLNKLLYRFDIKMTELLNFKNLYQLAVILDISGSTNRSYHSIDTFFVEKIKELEGSPDDTESSMPYQIDLLYLVANIFFRQKKFEESLFFLDQMHERMSTSPVYTTNLRKDQHQMLKALNLNYLGKHLDAAHILDEHIDNRGSLTGAMPNVLLTRLMIHIQQGEFREANKILAKFQRSDLWYEQHIGLDWVLNKKYMELILHIEFDDIDLVESRLQSLSRKYKSRLKKEGRSQALPFLKILRRYFKDPGSVSSDAFKQFVYQSLEIRSKEEADILLLSFYAWIKAKMENRNLYEVTLELVN